MNVYVWEGGVEGDKLFLYAKYGPWCDNGWNHRHVFLIIIVAPRRASPYRKAMVTAENGTVNYPALADQLKISAN